LMLFTLAGGALIGTLVWLFEGSPKDGYDVPGNISVSDFVRSVTMRTPEGKVFIWGSIANVLLAIALFASAGAVPVRDWVPWGALLWPFLMFVVHVRLTTMTSGRWFGTVMQATHASALFHNEYYFAIFVQHFQPSAHQSCNLQPHRVGANIDGCKYRHSLPRCLKCVDVGASGADGAFLASFCM